MLTVSQLFFCRPVRPVVLNYLSLNCLLEMIESKPVFGKTNDDWETDPHFINDIVENESRWGSKTVEGSGHLGSIDLNELRDSVIKSHEIIKSEELKNMPQASFGYGGKFGVENDRMDQSAAGNDYVANVPKHSSQTDYVKGFGTKFGVLESSMDKSALPWTHKEIVDPHPSQKDYTYGYGGKFGKHDGSSGLQSTIQPETDDTGKKMISPQMEEASQLGYDLKAAKKMFEHKINQQGKGDKINLKKSSVAKISAKFEGIPSKVVPKPGKISTAIFEKNGVSNDDPKEAEETSVKVAIKDRIKQFQPAPKSNFVYKPVEPTATTTFHKKEILPKSHPDSSEKNEKVLERDICPPEEMSVSEENISPLCPPESVKEEAEIIINELYSPSRRIKSPEIELEKSEPELKTETSCVEQYNMDERQKDPIEVTYETIPETTKGMAEHPGKNEISTHGPDPGDALYENVNDIMGKNGGKGEVKEDENKLLRNQLEELGLNPADLGLVAVAMYDYQAGEDDELTFDPGELITHINKIDDGWWTGFCRGKEGLFPANYVQILEDNS